MRIQSLLNKSEDNQEEEYLEFVVDQEREGDGSGSSPEEECDNGSVLGGFSSIPSEDLYDDEIYCSVGNSRRNLFD